MNFRNYVDKSYIPRSLYIERIRPFIGKGIIKVIIGQRRVGKSFFLFSLMNEIAKVSGTNIVYINKELADFDFIRTSHHLLEYLKKEHVSTKKNYVFIDEIQNIEQFELALRHLQTQGKWDIYCTGSNAFLLSGELATYLSGRCIQIRMFGLSYREFLQFHKLDDSDETLLKYLKFGGLPYLRHLELTEKIVSEYLQNIIDAIILKDVVSRYHIRNVSFLQNLIRFLADNVGNLFSAKSISDYLKSQKLMVSPKVILDFIYYLESAFMVLPVKRYDIRGKKILEFGEKIFFEDIGIRNSLSGFGLGEIQKVLENAIYLHLVISGWNVFTGKSENNEIDFVCEKNQEKMYLQVAYLLADEKTIKREFGNLLEIKDNYPKYVISMDSLTGNTYQGIPNLSVRNFLLKDWQ